MTLIALTVTISIDGESLPNMNFITTVLKVTDLIIMITQIYEGDPYDWERSYVDDLV